MIDSLLGLLVKLEEIIESIVAGSNWVVDFTCYYDTYLAVFQICTN